MTKAKALLPILELEDPESALIFERTRRTAAELTNYCKLLVTVPMSITAT